MKINIVCVGKIKEKYFTDAVAEYAKRLSRFCDFKIIELPEFPPKSQAEAEVRASVDKESAKILEAVGGHVVLTAINGKNLTSPQLAAYIDGRATSGVSEISFVIGGSNGVSPAVEARADMLLSFGLQTYPHQLMRVILAEQIYRAFTITHNMPYHK